jgi:NADH-quinone oxidoreductase subunit N
LIYGASGSFNLAEISQYVTTNTDNLPAIFYVGMILMIVGLSFKISAAPFHFWTADVYQGAPTIVTTYMATIVKTAAFAGIFRLFTYCFATQASHSSNIIWGMAALTILIGNLTAMYQSSVKRMLAYSSVAHAGYLLIAVLALNSMSASSILLYTCAYSIATIAAFTVLVNVINATGNDSIESFYGLAKRNPFMAFVMVVTMLSLAGIPPTAGFFAKYYIFSAAMKSHYIYLVLIAILGSLIGVYYYFKIIIAMFRDSADTTPITLSYTHKFVLFITAAIAIALGLFPNAIIGLI